MEALNKNEKKAEQKGEKSSDDKFTVKIKSRKTSQITQGWVRKEDGKVICYAMWRNGRENGEVIQDFL